MATIATIAVALTARTKKFVSGFDRAAKRVRQFGRVVRKMAMAVAAGAAVMGGSTILIMRHFAQVGDTVAKMARRTGLSTEAISELGYVAEISGGSLEGLEKGIKRMAKAITDGKAGMTTYVRAFDLMGLKVTELEGLSPEAVFLKIGAAIAAIENPITRVSAASDVFGKAGTRLLPLFALGAEGLEAYRKQARLLGISLSSDMTGLAEKVTDSWTNLKKSISGLIMHMGKVLAPYVIKVLRWITGGFIWARKAIVPIIDDITFGMIVGFSHAALSLVSFGADVKHFITKEMPAYLKYFVENWDKTMAALSPSLETSLGNLWGNIKRFYEKLPDIMWVEWEDVWHPLGKGFELELDNFPEIADRAMGKVETTLSAWIAKLGKMGPEGLAKWLADMGELGALPKFPELELAEDTEDVLKKFVEVHRPAALERGTAAAYSAALPRLNRSMEKDTGAIAKATGKSQLTLGRIEEVLRGGEELITYSIPVA